LRNRSWRSNARHCWNGYQCPDQNQEQNIRRATIARCFYSAAKERPYRETGIKATNSDREHDNQEDYDERANPLRLHKLLLTRVSDEPVRLMQERLRVKL
jgi:hypothetical protein